MSQNELQIGVGRREHDGRNIKEGYLISSPNSSVCLVRFIRRVSSFHLPYISQPIRRNRTFLFHTASAEIKGSNIGGVGRDDGGFEVRMKMHAGGCERG